MEENRIFRARGVGDFGGRTSSTTVLPFHPTSVDTIPICNEAMDDKPCMFVSMIPLFFLLYDTDSPFDFAGFVSNNVRTV